MSGLNGKIAVVTGASRGIGKQTALRLAASGATVVVHYRNSQAAADDVVRQIETHGGSAFALQANFSDAAGPRHFYEQLDPELQRRFGSTSFDILVNNAGAGTRAVIEDVSEAELDETLQVDLKSPFFLIKYASPRLRDGGRIVNVSSMGTRVAYPEMVAYSAAKAGLEALTLMLAAHFGPRGITVNAVLPGATATDMNPGAQDPVRSQALAQTIALRRVGQPEDIADVIAFLVSDAGRWVTGQRIDASGGQRI
ncbi:SDR family NAD(P)-dependent oxidoreductase [Variovorax sp. M-6]|uniref:SDR family NAD(P)-dependent oxidoreductase n=1 Tax=Variovorax sp. M-6 TaxID=3233041 RepID=UPI003F9E37F0